MKHAGAARSISLKPRGFLTLPTLMYITNVRTVERDIVLAIAKALHYRSYDELSLSDDDREQMKVHLQAAWL